MSWPLMPSSVRLLWLRGLWALASGDAVLSAVAPCAVAAWLPDTRMLVFSGREDFPRSLGSVYACLVTRFLGGRFRGTVKSSFPFTPAYVVSSIAVSADGQVMYHAHHTEGRILGHRLSDGTLLHSIGNHGTGPLEFRLPCAVCLSPDGYLFVAEQRNARVQVLNPALGFHGFLGEHQLREPGAVDANNAIVAVSAMCDAGLGEIHVLSRADGTFLAHFSSSVSPWFSLQPCILADGQRIAVADRWRCSVRVFTLDGVCARVIDLGPRGSYATIARSADDNLFVALADHDCIRVFDRDGDDVGTIRGDFFHMPYFLKVHKDMLIVGQSRAVITCE